MVTTGHADDSMGKLAAFAGVHKFPSRVKCAILSWHAAKSAAQGRSETVSTEETEE
jgi:nitrogen fixation NifU-like protein